MARHRRNHLNPSNNGLTVDGQVDMGDVTAATHSPDVPQNPDGSVQMEGEVTVEQAQKIGAVSAESDAFNRRTIRSMAGKATPKSERGGVKVTWNSREAVDVFASLYEPFKGEWGSMTVYVTRLDPQPNVTFPPVKADLIKDASALYAYVERCHGASPEATYEVRFKTHALERGKGTICMPDRSVRVQEAAPAPSPYERFSHGHSQNFQPGFQPGFPGEPRVTVNVPPAPPAIVQSGMEARMADMMSHFQAQSQAQTKEMMGVFLTMLDSILKKPQMPAGFIPLPEGYPIPPGYVALPGGCIPGPPALPPPAAPTPIYVPMPTPPSSAGERPAPVAAPVAPMIVQQAPPPVGPAEQVAGAVKMMTDMFKGMENLRQLFQQPGVAVAQAAEAAFVDEPEAPPPDRSIDIGNGLKLVRDDDGNTNWGGTLLGALPKVGSIFKETLSEYSKASAQQAQQSQTVLRQRIELANAVARAQGVPTPSPPASLPAAAPASVTPPVQAPRPPVQAVSTQPPAPRAPTRPMPNGIPSKFPTFW
jgi:hypothetical protein